VICLLQQQACDVDVNNMTVKLLEETVTGTKTMRSVKRAKIEQRRKLNIENLKAKFF
jgi:hypothetical protein